MEMNMETEEKIKKIGELLRDILEGHEQRLDDLERDLGNIV